MRRSREIRRRPLRHTVRLSCQVVRERDFRLVADRIENLSTYGMLVAPADPVLTGEKLIVSFQLPGTGKWFDVGATVRRVVHGRRPNETTRKLGLEFDELRPYERYQLKRALEKAPVAPPGGRPGRRNPRGLLQELVRSANLSA